MVLKICKVALMDISILAMDVNLSGLLLVINPHKNYNPTLQFSLTLRSFIVFLISQLVTFGSFSSLY